MRARLVGLALSLAAAWMPAAQAQDKVLRIAMTASDVPTPTGDKPLK